MRFKQPYAVVRRTTTNGSAVFFYRVYHPETGQRLEYSTGRTSKAAALAFAEDLRKSGNLIPSSREFSGNQTFAEWAKDWWGPDCPYCRSQEARGRILARSYKALNEFRVKNQILPTFGSTRLRAITSGKVERWLLGMDASPRVKNTALQVLRTMLGEAERLELIPINPVKRVHPVVQVRKVRDLFSPQEIRDLFDPETVSTVWAEAPKAQLACLLAVNSAMRAGEILGLQVTSLHLEGNVPWVGVDRSWDRKELKGTKTGVNRKVPIPVWLGERLKAIAPASGFLFSDDQGTSPITYFRLRKALQKALVAIGISPADQQRRGLGMHAFRHWVNTSLRGKVSDDIIRAMTGHTTEEMTEHYTSHRIEDLSSVVSVIQAVFDNGKVTVAQ